MTPHAGDTLPTFVIDSVSAVAMKEWAVFLADPNIVANTITVRRGSEGTTPATGSSGDVLRLIGNSHGPVLRRERRTKQAQHAGSERRSLALRRLPARTKNRYASPP